MAAQREKPTWVEVDNLRKWKVLSSAFPERSDLSAEINEQLIVELYSQSKANKQREDTMQGSVTEFLKPRLVDIEQVNSTRAKGYIGTIRAWFRPPL